MERIMERFDYEFGYFKAYFFVCGFVALGFLSYGIINWEEISEVGIETCLGLGIACVIMIIISAIIFGITLRNLPGENPILLALGMAAVGIFVGVFIGFFILAAFGTVLGKIIEGNSSDTSEAESDTSVFAQTRRYRRDDGEIFVLCTTYSDNSALLSYTSKNATTVQVHNNGTSSVPWITDSEGNHYEPVS